MRKLRTVMATTHVDRHNEQFTLEALEFMRQQIRSSFLPFIVDHDPRWPPIGRVVDADIISLPDGEYALETAVELFEEGPIPPLSSDRSIHFRELPQDSLLLTIDRSFSRPQFRDAVTVIEQEFGTRTQFEGKKALEPIGVLLISAGGFALGTFAKSFFSRLGENAADLVCEKLKQIFRHREEDDADPLLRIEVEFKHNQSSRRAEVILTGPSDGDIDSFFQEGLQRLDHRLPSCLDGPAGIVKYVFAYSQNGLTFRFAVRSDAITLLPETDDTA